ncbi:hypothetical protein Dimus_000544 [Dionaea muscipula]
MPNRRSGRLADCVIKRSENVKVSEWKRKEAPKRKRKEESTEKRKPREAAGKLEPRSKRKHNVNVGEDNDKEAEQLVKTDHYDDTFLGMCGLRRENGVWWLGSGANRRRDEVKNEEENEEETMEENEEGIDSEKTVEEDKSAKSTPADFEWEQVKEETKAAGSDTIEEFFDAEDGGKFADVGVTDPADQPMVQQKRKGKAKGVDPFGTIPDYDLIYLQAEFDRALKTNPRFQELLQQINPNLSTPSRP